jgi:hypothetical protein
MIWFWFIANVVLAVICALMATYGPIPVLGWFGCAICIIGAADAFIFIRRSSASSL